MRVVAAMGLAWALFAAAPAAGAEPEALHLIPRPAAVDRVRNCRAVAAPAIAFAAGAPLSPAGFGTGAELLLERWAALGIAARRSSLGLPLAARRDRSLPPQGYTLDIGPDEARIGYGDDDGLFYAFATLAQLPARGAAGWQLPCVHVRDAPALRWRVLSDDISRGPLPNMRYFKERIRTIAAFKMNGYAPYAEHAVFDPAEPLPAPLDGLTGAELRELDRYAKRFHVSLIPQQQSFAHMHNTLKWERYAPLAETPHGYLLAPSNPRGEAYAKELIRNQLAAVPHPPFFHIGADEPVDLGRGQSAALVDRDGEGPVYTRFVASMAQFVSGLGTRPLIWDDALSRHPELFAQLPRGLVFVNWHYGDETDYTPFIRRIADGGFDQMVAPGSLNWNEIFPDLDLALQNISRFTRDGKAAHVLGLFQTVWHDDGETLYEATWVPVTYAAASGWEAGNVEPSRFLADFPAAFFGVDDRRYADDLAALAAARSAMRGTGVGEGSDYLFWADPFDPRWYARVGPALNASVIRTQAEIAIAHLRVAAPPPLHANAAAVMQLAARRYDLFGRNLQIAREAQDIYAQAFDAVQAKSDAFVERNLFLTKYLFWEQRDAFLELVPLVAAAWSYENRPGHELSVLERYHVAADRAIVRSDAVSRAVYDFYEPHKTLPPWEQMLAPTLPATP